MRFADYADPVVTLAEDVVNSYRHSVEVDDLDPAALTELVRSRGWTGRPATRADVAAVRALRAPLRAVFEERSIDRANALFLASGLVPELVEHDASGWHLHLAQPHGRSLPDWVAGHSAFALMAAIERGGAERLHRCSGPGCHAVFFDLSRNKLRQFCSPAVCGNRVHVQAHRDRRASTPDQKAR